jgi:HEAT repeat protein
MHAYGRIVVVILCLSVCSVTALPSLARSTPAARAEAREVLDMFHEEMQTAALRLRWQGEPLTEDTVYAAALTGLTWEPAWGKEHLFSLAWGDLSKVPMREKHADRQALVEEVKRLYAAHDYERVVEAATAGFSLDEIGCDVELKEAVGSSLLETGQPERAFSVLSAPFEPTPALYNPADADRRFRQAALEAAQRAAPGLRKEAITFALSLLLAPGDPASRVDTKALDYLEKAGVDVDRVLLGILQAPERLRGLPAYSYAAADLLSARASRRLLPFLLHLANSDDAYLRSRAVVALGRLAYRTQPGDPPGWADSLFMTTPRQIELSAGERRLIDREIREAIETDNFRLRAAGAFALALTGDADSVPLLQKLAKDRAYVLSAPEGEKSRVRRIQFPVRMAAATGLARCGLHVETGGGDFAGAELEKAKRGGQDVTNDLRNLRRDIASQIVVCPMDATTVVPLQTARR